MISNRQQGHGLLALALGAAGTFYACASSQAAVISFDTTAADTNMAFVSETDACFTVTPESSEPGTFYYSGPTPPNNAALANSIFIGPPGPPYTPKIAGLSVTGGTFDFTSIDLASRTGSSTYSITGYSGSTLVFTETGSLFDDNAFVVVDATAADASTPITSLDILLAPGKGATAINVDDIAVTEVPEPMTTSLLGLGGMALAAFGWRRRLA